MTRCATNPIHSNLNLHLHHPNPSIQQAEARLMEEQSRVAYYLNNSTDPKLRAIVEEELVKQHAATLVEVWAREEGREGGEGGMRAPTKTHSLSLLNIHTHNSDELRLPQARRLAAACTLLSLS